MSILRAGIVYKWSDIIEHVKGRGTIDTKELYEVECEYVRDTKKAWLFDFGEELKRWVPKSACAFELENDSVEIKGWFIIEMLKEKN